MYECMYESMLLLQSVYHHHPMYVCMYVCMYVGDGGCARVCVCVAASGAPYDGVEPGHGADRAPQQQDLTPPACPYHRR